MRSASFERFGGACALVVGVAGFLYSAAFIARVRAGAPFWTLGATAVLLLVGGLAATAALVAVYQRLRETDAAFALWALILGEVAALGSMIHAGFDLARYVDPPAAGFDLPASPIDPRGLLTFGVAGLALLVVAWLIVRGGQFPVGLGYLGYLSAALLVIIYLGRLIILDPNRPILGAPAVLEGLVVNPVWYVWLGLRLRATPGAMTTSEPQLG